MDDSELDQSEKHTIPLSRRVIWDERWAPPKMNAFWLNAALPPEIKPTLDDGWIGRDHHILEVG